MEPSPASRAALDIISVAFGASGLSVSDYLITLLETRALDEHPCTVNLVNNTDKILSAFLHHPYSKDSAFDWATTIMRKTYSESIRNLISSEEWHFNASHASAKQLEEFRIEDMALKMKELAPDLWFILDVFLMGERKPPAGPPDADHNMSLSENPDQLVSDAMDVVEDGGSEGWGSTQNTGRTERNKSTRRDALCTIVRRT